MSFILWMWVCCYSQWQESFYSACHKMASNWFLKRGMRSECEKFQCFCPSRHQAVSKYFHQNSHNVNSYQRRDYNFRFEMNKFLSRSIFLPVLLPICRMTQEKVSTFQKLTASRVPHGFEWVQFELKSQKTMPCLLFFLCFCEHWECNLRHCNKNFLVAKMAEMLDQIKRNLLTKKNKQGNFTSSWNLRNKFSNKYWTLVNFLIVLWYGFL